MVWFTLCLVYNNVFKIGPDIKPMRPPVYDLTD